MDLIILGAGPSSLILAYYIRKTRSHINNIYIVDDNIDDEWHCTYCLWLNEINGSWLCGDMDYILKHRWNNSTVLLNDTHSYDLNQAYALIDNTAFKNLIYNTIKDNTHITHIIKSTATKIMDYNNVILKNGTNLKADLIIDCTGHYSKFTKYGSNTTRNMQIFYGEEIEFEKELYDFDQDSIRLFDYRFNEKNRIPSFCYILPTSSNTLFMEETILTTREHVSYDELKERLHTRIHKMGLHPFKTISIEQNRFPMGGSLPLNSNLVIGFGAAGRMVNPLSGYMIGYLINEIPSFVDVCINEYNNCKNKNNLTKNIYDRY